VHTTALARATPGGDGSLLVNRLDEIAWLVLMVIMFLALAVMVVTSGIL
jgi:hypothetical protein